jgi:hypothetical protein
MIIKIMMIINAHTITTTTNNNNDNNNNNNIYIIIYIWDYEGYMWIIETTDPKWHAHLSRDSKKILSV